MAIQYRPLLESDIIFLKVMLFETLFVPKGEAPFSRSILDEPYIAKYIHNFGMKVNDYGFIALCKGEPVGAIWGRIFKQPDPGYGYFDDATPEMSMAIKSTYRNQGIGTQLIKLLANHYQAQKVNTLSLSVDKRNVAMRLYQRLGFSTVARENQSCTMVKRLDKKK